MLFIFIFFLTIVSAAIVPIGIQPYQHMLTWTVRNDNLWPLLFYYYNPCLMENGICVRHNNGSCLHYEGIHASLAEGWDYEPLWPFQSYSCSFDVTQTFDMEKAGIYSIQFLGSEGRSESETQLTTTLSFGDEKTTPRSTFYSCEKYFSPAPTSPSNIIYMRKGTDDEIRISFEKEKAEKRLLSDDDESDHGF